MTISDTQSVAILAALGHPLRLDLLRLLLPYGEAGLPSGQMALRMGVQPSSLHPHLRQMSEASILLRRYIGDQIGYAANLHILETALRHVIVSLAGNVSITAESVSARRRQ